VPGGRGLSASDSAEGDLQQAFKIHYTGLFYKDNGPSKREFTTIGPCIFCPPGYSDKKAVPGILAGMENNYIQVTPV